MIPALTCLVLPFIGNCSAFVRDVPKITDVVHRKTYYTGRAVLVTGRVRRLNQWTSEAYGPEELFWICDHDCIRVYMRARSPIREAQVVTVTGQYYAAYHQYRHTYYNEIEGTQVFPRE